MNRILTAALVGAALTACTVKVAGSTFTTTTVAVTTSSTTSTTPPTTTQPDLYQKYLSDIAAYTALVEATGFSTEQVLGFADIVCGYYRDGGNTDGLIQLLYEVGTQNNLDQNGLNALAAGAGVAVMDVCPQYQGR